MQTHACSPSVVGNNASSSLVLADAGGSRLRIACAPKSEDLTGAGLQSLRFGRAASIATCRTFLTHLQGPCGMLLQPPLDRATRLRWAQEARNLCCQMLIWGVGAIWQLPHSDQCVQPRDKDVEGKKAICYIHSRRTAARAFSKSNNARKSTLVEHANIGVARAMGST